MVSEHKFSQHLKKKHTRDGFEKYMFVFEGPYRQGDKLYYHMPSWCDISTVREPGALALLSDYSFSNLSVRGLYQGELNPTNCCHLKYCIHIQGWQKRLTVDLEIAVKQRVCCTWLMSGTQYTLHDQVDALTQGDDWLPFCMDPSPSINIYITGVNNIQTRRVVGTKLRMKCSRHNAKS